MDPISTLDACLAMLKRHGVFPSGISINGESISISGLEVLPPSPAEEALEAAELRISSELSKDNVRILGLE